MSSQRAAGSICWLLLRRSSFLRFEGQCLFSQFVVAIFYRFPFLPLYLQWYYQGIQRAFPGAERRWYVALRNLIARYSDASFRCYR